MALLEALFTHQLVLVTGKGGTGKTTLAAALGLAAARRGLRTLLVETYGARRLPELFGLESTGYRVLELAPGLHAQSLTPADCTEEYVLRHLRFRTLYRVIFRNRVMGPFMDAVPGLPDLIQLGKVMDVLEGGGGLSWDLVVVDAPATGHGLTLLGAPRAMMEMVPAGPFQASAKRVFDLVHDPRRSALALVTLPETLPVNETLELARALRDFRPQLSFCALNQVLPSHPGLARLAAGEPPGDEPRLQEAWELARLWARRVEERDRAWQRLSAALYRPVPSLPLLPHRQPSPEELLAMAESLDAPPSPEPAWLPPGLLVEPT